MSVKLSQLPTASIPLSGGELIPLNQGGTTYTTNLSNIKSYTSSDLAGLSGNFAVKNANNNFTAGQKINGALSASMVVLSSGAYLKNNSTSVALTFDNSALSGVNNFYVGGGAGCLAFSVNNSNFIGECAGHTATNACNSNFLGTCAGRGSHAANDSNFLGSYTGLSATGACASNFLGYCAGYCSHSANDSNFLGSQAGLSAANACYSNFLGYHAGCNATTASNSIFIGYESGAGQTASQNIFIGDNTNTNPANLTGCIVIGHGAVATAQNTLALGSISVPLSTVAGEALSTSTLGLKVNVNGTYYTIPLL